MKIVCENCGAKYSIADEKVKGKVFKIRCKKCSESILVRGDANQPAMESEPVQQAAAVHSRAGEDETEAETRVFDYAGYHPGGETEAVWHIVIEDQQQGPYSEANIKEYIQSGSLTGDTLVWREGFDDWMLLSDVPELWGGAVEAKPAARAAAAPQGGGLFDEQPRGNAQSSLFDEQPSGGLFSAGASSGSPFDSGGGIFSASGSGGGALGDVFSSAAPEPAGGLFESAGKSSNLFRKKEEAVADEGIFSSTREPAAAPTPIAAAASPRVSAAQAMMTGQRNENSVLFSLSNLQALAAGPAKEAETRKPTAPGFTAAGPHGEEASGLIDIRSLAGSLSTAEQNNSVDDLISMGGGGFSPALGAPVLAAQHEGMSSTVKIAIAGGAVAFLSLIVVVLVLAFSGNDDAQTAAQAQILALQKQIEELSKKGGAGDAETLSRLQEELKKKQDAASKLEGATAENTASTADKDDDSKKSGGGGSKKKPGGKTGGSSGSASESGGGGSGESAAAPTPTPSKPSKVSELDDLLGPGGGGGSSKPNKPSGGGSSSGTNSGGSLGPAPKASLSREDVQKGMGAVAPAVQGCGQGKGGSITMNITIGKTGRVSSASATGAFAGTPIGDCAARAVRRAKFPESQQNLNVKYPFKL